MKKFFLKTLSTLLASIILFVIMFFSIISIHSGKFPPTLALAKEYLNNILKAKENYTALLNKSEKYIKNELAEKKEPTGDNPVAETIDFEEISLYMKQIKTQLNRIEQQNNQILNSLKK